VGGGPGGFGGPDAPAFALTVALSYASFTFDFLTSGRPSIIAFRGRSPTIRMRVPRTVAASFLAPSNESSSKVASCSERGFICPGWIGTGEVERQRARNLREPSFTCGFFEPRVGVTSPRISPRFDLTTDQRRSFNQVFELTVLKTASNANPMASVTFAFRSLSLSRTGGTTASR